MFYQLIFGIICSSISFCCIMPYLACKSWPRRITALVLLGLWICLCGTLTFRKPFMYVGNGFFSCWLGLLQSVNVLYREVFQAPAAYAKVLPY